MTPITISVSKDHISEGVAYSCIYCPVALAIDEAVGTNFSIVDKEKLEWRLKDAISRRCKTPGSVRRFITRFDSNQDVEPFTFELRDESL